jgi:bifunctional pyridoxal-dependent enzyme with beta-cystathionase and maltose regulon repressor activities
MKLFVHHDTPFAATLFSMPGFDTSLEIEKTKQKSIVGLIRCTPYGKNGMDEFRFIDRSSSNAEKYTLREKLFGTETVQPMWVADMDIATPECVMNAVKERLNHPILGYEIMSERAFEAQIEWMRAQHDFTMQRQWLSYSPSVVASIGCAIRALSEEGDEVIVMDPVYPPFYSMVRDNNRHVLLHPLKQDKEGVTLSSRRKALRNNTLASNQA